MPDDNNANPAHHYNVTITSPVTVYQIHDPLGHIESLAGILTHTHQLSGEIIIKYTLSYDPDQDPFLQPNT